MQQREWEEQGARLKIFTAEVVSLRLDSYSEVKAATYAQEGGNGTTSGDRAKDVSDNEEGVAAQTSCFNIDLSKNMADNCLSPLVQKMADVVLIIALRQFWLRRIFFGKQALQKKTGGHMLTAKIGTNRSDRYDRAV